MHSLHIHSTRHFAAERHSTDVEQWARIEGKSETMSADLIATLTTTDNGEIATSNRICQHCFASATIGAAVALLVERLMLGE